MATETNLSITSIAGLTNNPNQTITGTGVAGATVKVLDGTTLLGTTVVGSDGTWSEVVVLSGEGGHLISASGVAGNVASNPEVTQVFSFIGNSFFGYGPPMQARPSGTQGLVRVRTLSQQATQMLRVTLAIAKLQAAIQVA